MSVSKKVLKLRTRRGLIRLLLPAFIAVGGLVGLYIWSQQPVVATIRQAPSPSGGSVQSANVTVEDEGLKELTTVYFSTSIPASLYVLKSSETPQSPIKATYNLRSRVSRTADVSIMIGSKQGSLDEVSAAKLRQTQPENYQVAVVPNAPVGSIAFTKTTGYETAVFWPEGQLYVSIVGSGQIQDREKIEASLQHIMATWHFK